jgi:UDP-2,3-diacylglucosamine pyrophosphatase LpxH
MKSFKFLKKGKISQAFENAPEILFDETSKIVFVADCHRSDASGADAFFPNRNIYSAALNYYTRHGFTYVELGDGDELWEIRKFSRIVESYGKTFEKLSALYKEGRFLSVVGNHDMVKKNPKWVSENMRIGEEGESVELFPGIIFPMGIVFKHREKGWQVNVLHGHQPDPLNNTFWMLARFLVRYLWRPLALVGVKNPLRAANNPKKKISIASALIKWAAKENVIIIAGHTHKAVFPKPGGSLYFNAGCCVHKEDMRTIEIKNGAIALIRWSFETDEEGILRVARFVINGPEPLANYFAQQPDAGSL